MQEFRDSGLRCTFAAVEFLIDPPAESDSRTRTTLNECFDLTAVTIKILPRDMLNRLKEVTG